MKPHEAFSFLPAAAGIDPLARWALRQVTLRLRREVAWLWRERIAQGIAERPAAEGSLLPPFADSAQGALDLLRYDDDRRAFFGGDVTARHLSELIAAPPPADGAPARGTFGWVARRLQLEPLETFVLALALLPAFDSAAAPVFACVHNDATRTEPTLALAQRLWDEPAALLRCVDPAQALFGHGLVVPAAPAGWHAALAVSPLVARELLGLAAAPPASLRAVAEAPVAVPAAAERRRIVPVLGAPESPLAETAARAAAQAGLALLQPVPGTPPEALREVMTVAWLRGAALFVPLAMIGRTDPAAHDAAPVALPLPALPLTLFVGAHERAELKALGTEALPPLEVPDADHAARLAAWQRVLPSRANQPLLSEVARRFRCQVATIARIGDELALLGRPPTADELFAATRANLDLGQLAQPVAPRFCLDELMLPPAQTRQLQELVTAMANLGRTHHEWGTARAWNEGGLAAMFCGPPGTGKTMTSEALAHELRLPIYRIDLSQVVNKYIGETEKNLRRLFDAADAAEVVLFFDEADALFGKRTEVKDAHDRYANLEVSYLLERMERFKGLAILATNRRRDLDDAFLRRLRFVIEFPLPGAAERERIWRGVIPPGVDAGELDIPFLAQRFALAGGHIRAIVFHACLQSAGPGAPRRLTMRSVVRAVQREYDKLERASSLEQFGPYAALVAEERPAR